MGLLFLSFIVLVVFLPGIVTAQETAQNEDWQFFVDIYGWLPDIKGKSASGSDFEIKFSDILDSLNLTMMSVLGGQKDRWGFFLDALYMDIESDINITEHLPPGIPENVYNNVNLKALAVTPKASYNVLDQDKFKLNNIILATPDLDLQVARQRIVGDKLALSANRFTVYTSPKDKAIGVASKLFAGPHGRLGTFGQDQLTGAAGAAIK